MRFWFSLILLLVAGCSPFGQKRRTEAGWLVPAKIDLASSARPFGHSPDEPDLANIFLALPPELVADLSVEVGNFYELDGEPIRRAVGRPRVERDPFAVLWDLRESARELLGGELPDDTYPDEPIRRTVGKTRAQI